jgi:hypothetical protein
VSWVDSAKDGKDHQTRIWFAILPGWVAVSCFERQHASFGTIPHPNLQIVSKSQLEIAVGET